MADKIVVLNAGRIEQVGSPLDLYRSPRNLFVAGFIGSPKMNFITGDQAARESCVTLGVRPEHLAVTTGGRWNGTIGLAEHLGSDTFLKVVTDEAGELTVRVSGEQNLHHGDRISLEPQADRLYRFNADGLAL